ncbi:S100P-binding protein-like [Anabas testudineus]|uniref:S100P-binding protein n=1 Tax=Anabas testudineus TaxID=64144 RepID=A0A7N6BN29_ANATE|nr:S100P-binding protein-like [Anabas testudineus]
MAQTVHNEVEQTISNTVSRLDFQSCNVATFHLKPLSVYAKMTCHQETSVHHSGKPFNQFINFKVEKGAQKRQLEISSCDDGYDTPSKKFFFDSDIDDILCLNPIGTKAPEEVSARSCQNSTSCTLLSEQVGKCGPKLQRNEVLNGQENLRECRKDELEDKGYVSMSYTKNLNEMPTTASSSQPKAGEGKVLQDKCHPQGLPEQTVLSGQKIPVTVSDICSSVCVPLLDSVNCPVESLEGDVEDILNIGPPIFESSLCCTDTVTVHTGSEQSRLLSEVLQEGSIGPIHEHHTTEEVTVDTSYESTLPLQVQVKSVVVVVPRQNTKNNNPGSPHLSELDSAAMSKPDENKCKVCPRSQRPAIFNGEMDWEHEKERYIHLVKKHMNDSPVAAHDVMTELVSLMSHVADQAPGSGTPWQHPSDLTRRNHQKRFGSSLMPKMSLKEWQAKNGITLKRFAKVPKVFQRSQLP